MSDRRIREVAAGDGDNPSMLPEESCEDPEDLFEMIANRNKLKDNDVQALPPGSDEDFFDDSERSTETINDASMTEQKSSAPSARANHESSVMDDTDIPPDLPESPPDSPAKPSPRYHDSPSRHHRSPPSRAPRSPPSSRSSAPQKAEDPVAAYAERRSREEIEKEKEEAEKRELLMRFFEFEEAGVPCPKRFTLKSDLAEMRFEFKKLDDEFNRKKAIQMFKEGAKLVTNVIEVLNKKFDPIGWKSTDFSDNLNLKLGEMDWALRELHKKYFRRGGKPSPELFVLFAIGSTAVDTHKANTKKEEQRQQKANQNQVPPMYFPPPGAYPYPPPPSAWHGGAPPPPMYYNPAAARPPPGMPPKGMPPPQHPRQQPPQQHPAQQHPAQQPPAQQPPAQQQPVRPTIVPGAGGVPGTNPKMPPQQQMPPVDVSRVANPIPAPMPPPILGYNPTAGNPPEAPRKRSIPPPSTSTAGLGDMGKLMGSFAGGASSQAPAQRRTSNYSSNPAEQVEEDEEEEPYAESEEEQSSSTSKGRRTTTGPVEPPKDAAPGKIRYENGQLVFND